MFLLNDNILQLDTPFEHNGILYPANWLRLTSIEEKEAIGITEVPDPQVYDHRFYDQNGAARDLETVKTETLRSIGMAVKSMLTETDWYVIRKMERNISIPDNIVSYRAAVLAEASRLEGIITTADKVDVIRQAIETNRWATVEALLTPV